MTFCRRYFLRKKKLHGIAAARGIQRISGPENACGGKRAENGHPGRGMHRISGGMLSGPDGHSAFGPAFFRAFSVLSGSGKAVSYFKAAVIPTKIYGTVDAKGMPELIRRMREEETGNGE